MAERCGCLLSPTDYGAWRVRRRWTSFKLRLLHSALQRGDHRTPKKGFPGPDSYNACLSRERIGVLDFGSVFGFAEALAILLTAGIPVDIKIDDFTSLGPEQRRQRRRRPRKVSEGSDTSPPGPTHIPRLSV
jgi:hypothetical protein